MNFVQIQQITMPENVGYITELIAIIAIRVSATLLLGFVLLFSGGGRVWVEVGGMADWCEFVHASLHNLCRNMLS